MSKGALKQSMTVSEFREYMAKVEAGKDSKYRAIPTETADGQKFKSKLEAEYYRRCWVLQQAGEITKIEREVRFELVVNGVFIAAYLLDFRVTYADGRVDHVDCKSAPTVTLLYKVKKALMLALHGITVREEYEQTEEFVDRSKGAEKSRRRRTKK